MQVVSFANLVLVMTVTSVDISHPDHHVPDFEVMAVGKSETITTVGLGSRIQFDVNYTVLETGLSHSIEKHTLQTGAGGVAPEFENAVHGMKVGEHRRFKLPIEMVLGEGDPRDAKNETEAPPGSTLEIDVFMHEISEKEEL